MDRVAGTTEPRAIGDDIDGMLPSPHEADEPERVTRPLR